MTALLTGGKLGATPDFYRLVVASRACPSVRPWEWLDVPLYWLEVVLWVEGVEGEAREILSKRQRGRHAAGLH